MRKKWGSFLLSIGDCGTRQVRVAKFSVYYCHKLKVNPEVYMETLANKLGLNLEGVST